MNVYLLQLFASHRSRGHKFFELSNHLGNVLAVISDRRLGPDPNADGLADRYRAQVTSARDYWAFGLELHGRTWAAGVHRYGFNGKENDRSGEWGTGLVQDYGFRLYAPAIGKFLSVDPLRGEYPWYTPYSFAECSPIEFIDLDGKEKKHYAFIEGKNGQPNKLEFLSQEDFSLQVRDYGEVPSQPWTMPQDQAAAHSVPRYTEVVNPYEI